MRKPPETSNRYCDNEQIKVKNPALAVAMENAESKQRKQLLMEQVGAEQNRVYEAMRAAGSWGGGESPYRASLDDVLKLIERLREMHFPLTQHTPANRVTDFTDWLYKMYLRGMPHTYTSSRSALERGRAAERQVLEYKNKLQRAMRYCRYQRDAGWTRVYVGMGDEESEPMMISTLTVNEEPLWGKPDLVYMNASTGEIAIHEIKCSDADIPSDGWPNLRAQLWAYSRADRFRFVNEISLVGEVWGGKPVEIPSIRAKFKWKADCGELNRSCSALFEAYGGRALANAPYNRRSSAQRLEP